MKIFNDISQLKSFRGGRRTALTIGNFDGCHVGHQALIRRMVASARGGGLLPAILTFDPHPSEALGLIDKIPRVQSLECRLKTFEGLGVEAVVVIKFDGALSQMPASVFVQTLLVSEAGAQVIAIGDDFRFGHKRAGDIKLLKSLASDHGFEVEMVPPVEVLGAVASSTRVRKSLAEDADLESAQLLLGRPWSFQGKVVKGDQIGRTMGFPTANLEYIETLIPKHGVYAVLVSTKEPGNMLSKVPAVMNIGVRPTVGGRILRVEVHVLDRRDLDLYESVLDVELKSYLRPEIKFGSRDLLREQIARDCQNATAFLSSPSRF